MTEREKVHLKAEKEIQSYAALGIGLICIFIGLPLWWKTTEVYRVNLPYSEISALSNIPLTYSTNIEVISVAKFKDLSHAAKLLQDYFRESKNAKVANAVYRINVREPTSAEKTEFQQIKSIKENIQRIDDKLNLLSGTDSNKYSIYVIPSTFSMNQIYVGRYRNILIPEKSDLTTLINIIGETVKNQIIREQLVDQTIVNARGARSLKPDKESMRSLRYNPGYDITFTLTVPQPDILDVSWPIHEGIEKYLRPLVDSINEYSSITISSQIQFFTTLQIRPQKNEEKNYFYFKETDLPQLINPIESTLGTSSSNNPELNFIIYIPTREQAPLYIQDRHGKLFSSNSFLSPRWGGVIVYNIPDQMVNESSKDPVQVDIKSVMEIFVSQIRLLLNLNSPSSTDQVYFEPAGIQGVSMIELDSWLRNRCLENLATATNTLQSLAQLLGQISNIVINDDIGREVENAVEHIRSSQKLLMSGSLKEAFLASKAAVIASEKAFFDPSLLELLYFPEDQKFAIYIPLFLPICIPVISSVFSAVKWLRKPE